jgi:hypothetical protein
MEEAGVCGIAEEAGCRAPAGIAKSSDKIIPRYIFMSIN